MYSRNPILKIKHRLRNHRYYYPNLTFKQFYILLEYVSLLEYEQLINSNRKQYTYIP